MASPLDQSKDHLEVLESEREVYFNETIEDLFCNEKTGLHVFFQRNEKNSHFIDRLVTLEHELDARLIFEEARDEDGFAAPEKVMDRLAEIFRAFGSYVSSTDVSVFDEAHISKEEIMGSFQSSLIKIALKFKDSQFDAEEYFLEKVPSAMVLEYSGTVPKTKTTPPQSILDIPSKPMQRPIAPPLSDAGKALTKGKVITMSFDQEAAIISMIKEMGLRITAESFSDDAIVRATVEQVRKVVDFAIRTVSKAIVRRSSTAKLEDLILTTTAEIIRRLQDLAIENKDKPVSQVIIYSYTPGKENLRAQLERTIHEEVSRYFHKIHISPATVAPPRRTETKRPSGRPVPPPPGFLETPQKRPKSAPPISSPRDLRAQPDKILKTLVPGDFRREDLRPAASVESVADDVANEVREEVVIPRLSHPQFDDAGDDEPTMVSPQPAFSPAANVPAAQPANDSVSPQLASLYGEEDEKTQSEPLIPSPSPEATFPAVTEAPKSSPPSSVRIPTPVPRVVEDSPVISVSVNGRISVPVVEQKATVVQPVQQQAPVASPKVQPSPDPVDYRSPPSWTKEPLPKSQPPKKPEPKIAAPVPVLPPKKSGFFSRAKKWVAGATLAAAAVLGIYSATRTESPATNNDQYSDVQPGLPGMNNNTPQPSSAKPAATSADTAITSPAPTVALNQQKPSENPGVSAQPKNIEQAPQIAAVLGSHSYAMGASGGAVPFTGTASMVEGGVDATPFAPVLKTASWYQNQQKAAELLLKIYDTNKSRLDTDTVNFVATHDKMLRELASQSDFRPTEFKSHFENHYAPVELLGAKGVYNTLLAFERVEDLYGGDHDRLAKDTSSIKLSIGTHIVAPDERFSKAVLYKAASPGVGTPQDRTSPDPQPLTPTPAPTTGQNTDHGTHHNNQYGFLRGTHGMNHGFVDTKAIDDAWDDISVDHEWDAIEAMHASTVPLKQNIVVAGITAHSDDDPQIEVSSVDISLDELNSYDDSPLIETAETDLHPAEIVEMDRREALLERGEVLVPPLTESESGSVLQALENGFIRECANGDQMDRVQQRVSKIRMGSLEEYEVMDDGKIYAKITSEDLEDLRQIVG